MLKVCGTDSFYNFKRDYDEQLYIYSGGKKNPDLRLIYQKRTNESQTVKQTMKNIIIIHDIGLLGVVVFKR